MLIQITTITGELVETRTIEGIPDRYKLVFWPCWYCGGVLVEMPAKFCCTAHRVYYHRKDIANALH